MNKPYLLNCIAFAFILLFCATGCEDEDENPDGDTEGQEQIESDTSAIFMHAQPNIWSLASVPNTGSFEFADETNNWATNYERAQISVYGPATFPQSQFGGEAWANSHYSRDLYFSEIGSLQEGGGFVNPLLATLDLAYFPKERGPYNFNVQGIDNEARLSTPSASWAGVQRPLDYTDFEETGIELISFWLLDPFLESGANPGTLYLNLGKVSEDVLKDGRISCETSLSVNGSTVDGENTPWAYVSNEEIGSYSFGTEENVLQQDLGLDGLDDAGEAALYQDFLTAIQNDRPAIYDQILMDPANDNYKDPFDQSIWSNDSPWLDRILRYTMAEGNSAALIEQSFIVWGNSRPDCEDINEDGSLQEQEAFFEYRIALQSDMQVGQSFITEIRIDDSESATVDGVPAKWYKFEIPIDDYDQAYGGINDFTEIPFMRLYLSNFSFPVVLRMGEFHLIRIE